MSATDAVRERALQFECEGCRLLAVLSEPATGAGSGLGVLIVVGGPQYRAGSHRQFVLLARALAAAGHAVMRFDFRGMGDSTGRFDGFEQAGPDLRAAVDALAASSRDVQCVVLWGLCDGASASLLYLHDRPDPRIAGLCLLNPWVRSATSLARTQVKHYYLQRLRQRSFWTKLLKGQVAGQAWRGLRANLRAGRQAGVEQASGRPSFQDRMAGAWAGFGGKVLLVLSGRDYTAKEFLEYTRASDRWAGLIGGRRVTRLDLPEADHTFSDAKHAQDVEQAVLHWLDGLRAPRQGARP